MRVEYASCAEEAVTLKWFAMDMATPPEVLAGYIAEMAPAFMKSALGE